MMRRDERTPEETAATIGFIVGTDSFLSGCGLAPARSFYALPVRSSEEAHVVMENMRRRSDMKRVRWVGKTYRPKLRDGDHFVIASIAEASRHYELEGFPKAATQLRFNAKQDQTYYCNWRNANRTMKYHGRCVGCGKFCYGFEDNENDPRGPLGDHADCQIYLNEGEESEKRFPCCALCGNEYDRYQAAMKKAMAMSRERT